MNINHIPAFKECYIMQQEDIERFANTLTDGFSQYNLFKYICNGVYNRDKMALFWKISLKLLSNHAICIADSKDAHSVLIYIPSKSKELNPLSYLRVGGTKMIVKLGIRWIGRLMRFESAAESVSKRYKTAKDGYLMAFATRIDKQGQHYGKKLMKVLLRYLDASGEGCYLETLKAENVAFYENFSFQLKEEKPLRSSNLTLYAMHRSKN